MRASKRPSVDGLVSITAAVCGPSAAASASRSTSPSGAGRHGDRAEAGHRRRRRVGAVRRVGHDHLGPLGVAACRVVGADHQDAGQLAVRAGGGLERDRVHAADLDQPALQLPQQLERALGELVGSERVERGEAGQPGGPLVDLGVVLHRARAQRIEAAVDRVVELREADEVADDFGLGQLGQAGRRRAQLRRGNAGQRVGRRMGHLGLAWPGRESSASVGCSSGADGQALPAARGPAGRLRRALTVPHLGGEGARRKRSISSSVVTSVAQTSSASRRTGSSGYQPASGRPASTPRSSRRRWTAGASATRTANSLRYGALWTRGAPAAASAASSLRAWAAPSAATSRSPCGPERRDVDRRGEGAQRLVGADVAGRLVAPDVLLARAQGHDVRASGRRGRPSGRRAVRAPGAPGRSWRRAGPGTGRRTAARCPAAGPRRRQMSAPYSPGGARTASETGSTTATNSAPAAWARRAASAIGSRTPKALGWPSMTPATGSLGVGQRALERGQVGRAVGQRRQLFERQVGAGEVGPRRVEEVAMDRARCQHAPALGRADGHQRRLGGRRGAVVVRRRDDVEPGQLGDQRLVLVDRLQRALADLGLVGRVGGVELAARQDLVDRRRDVVAVGAGAEEAGQVGPVAPRQRLQALAQGQLVGSGGGRSRPSGPHRCRDVGEELVDRVDAERGQHPRAVVGGVQARTAIR